MLLHLADVSIRSFLLALLAGSALWLLRNRRTAALQHAVWTLVMCGMLALFAFGQALPHFTLRVLDSGPVAPQAAAQADAEKPIFDPTALEGKSHESSAVQIRSPLTWRTVALSAYGVVALLFLAQFATGVFLVRKLLTTGRPISIEGVTNAYESDQIAVPFTVGWVHPRILLPAKWREWEREKLEAVLAHEGAHVRRRDNLVAALSGLNRCVLWFHPLAWVLQRKLSFLAEKACDESCVAELGDRERYARLLLDMASVVDHSHGRLRYYAMTMAAGSHLQQRIDSLLQNRRRFSRGMTRNAWAVLILCGIPLVLGAAALELDRRPAPLRLQMPRWTAPAPPAINIGQSRPVLPARAATVQLAQAQTPPVPASSVQPYTPKWDSISIKPCAAGDGAGRSGRGGAGGRGIPASPPGELFVNCMSVWELINHYVQNGQDPLLNDFGGPFEPRRIRGGPSWIYSDLYTLDAKSSDPAVNGPGADVTSRTYRKTLNGPMLQALIESRFQLKSHREVEQIPMYSLEVASSGLKLQPMEEGGCIPPEPRRDSPLPSAGEKPLCIVHAGWEGPNWVIDAGGQSLRNLAGSLGGMITDRPVLDKTGITGLFNFRLVFAHDGESPGMFPPGARSPFPPSNVTPAPPLSVVLEQQLGIRLSPDAGPREYIVIDSVERPTPQ
jgi:uncharacterized protein (TIGR03435 family)